MCESSVGLRLEVGPRTKVNSPLAATRRRFWSLDLLLMVSSCSLVSSLEIEIGLSPNILPICRSVAAMRCGDSKNTTVRVSWRNSDSHFVRSFDLEGAKPANTNESAGNPDEMRADSTALGPGIGTTWIWSAIAAPISLWPGSETSGVPASETSARSNPSVELREQVRDLLTFVVLVKARCRSRYSKMA